MLLPQLGELFKSFEDERRALCAAWVSCLAKGGALQRACGWPHEIHFNNVLADGGFTSP